MHLDAANNILAVTGKTRPNPGVGTMPSVSAATARKDGGRWPSPSRTGRSRGPSTTTTPERWIYDPATDRSRGRRR